MPCIYTSNAVVSASLRVLGTWALGWGTRLRTGLVAAHLTCAALPGLFCTARLTFPALLVFCSARLGLHIVELVVCCGSRWRRLSGSTGTKAAV